MAEKMYTLPEKFKELAEQFPDEIVLQIKESSGYIKYSYKKLYQISQSVAFSLQNLEIRKGDKVIIFLENRPEWVTAYFGILFAGAIAVPLDTQSSKEDLEYFLQNSGSKIIFTSEQFITLFSEISSSAKIITINEKMFLAKSPTIVETKISPHDIASILYTSGTTGKPKGVMLSHANFYTNFRSIDKLNILPKKINLLSILPLHHSFPFLITLIIPLFSRGLITYITSLRSEAILATMREIDATVLVGVPELYSVLQKNIVNEIKNIPFLLKAPIWGGIGLLWLLRKTTSINLTKLLLAKIHRAFGKHLKYLVSGGATLDAKTARFFMKLGFTILDGYGLTETAPVVTLNVHKQQKIDSVGMAIPDVKIKIVKPDENGIGEVAISGPNVMLGYYKKAKETSNALKDNWFYSGDLGYLDKDGYLYLAGRKAELIVLRSGKNVSPENVEAHYGKNPFSKEICVLAIKGKLMAVIVPDLDYFRKMGEVNVYEALRWNLENLSKSYPAYKRIMGFVIANEELPRTRLGKLKRFAVKEKYLNELLGKKTERTVKEIPLSDADIKLIASKTGKEVIAILQATTGLKREIQLTDHLEMDLGFDSLQRIELTAQLEKEFRIKIPNELMARVFTVRELILCCDQVLAEYGVRERISVKHGKVSVWGDILTIALDKNLMTKINLQPRLPGRVWQTLVFVFIRIIFKIFWRLKSVGEENLPDDKPFILCANHNSYLDGVVIGATIPPRLKHSIFFLGVRQYFELPIIRNIVKSLGIIPIDPAVNLISAMQASAYVLRNNKVVCVFPEGERSIDGKVKIFRKGVGILAKELNIDVVAAYIHGTFEVWPRGQRFPRLKPIKVIFGKPCNAKDLLQTGKKLGAADDYDAITLAIREEVIGLQRIKHYFLSNE